MKSDKINDTIYREKVDHIIPYIYERLDKEKKIPSKIYADIPKVHKFFNIFPKYKTV